MREAPLTETHMAEEGLFGSYASRVRGLEVTAQSKDDLRTRGGGTAMNSTVTELELTRRRAMRAIVKGVVIGVLGLAWLLVPVGYVHARENSASCAKGGWTLCPNGKCGTNYCTCDGKTLAPGDDCNKMREGKLTIFTCDGCSGNMIQVITPQPTRPGLMAPGVAPQGVLTPSVPKSRVKPPAGGTLQK